MVPDKTKEYFKILEPCLKALKSKNISKSENEGTVLR